MTAGIFHSPWWLDAVAPGAWREASVSADGVTLARWPYAIKRRLGLTRLLAPPLTPRLGPIIATDETKLTRRFGQQKELLFALVDQLPAHDQFLQNCRTGFDYWLPLSWRGFAETTLYSYTLEDLSDLDKTCAGFSKGTRSDINKARKSLIIRTDQGTGGLYDALATTLLATRKKMPFNPDLLQRIDKACLEQNQGRVFTAHDKAGRFVAGLLLVWDSGSAYYLLASSRPEARGSGAPSLLLWEAIQFASTVTNRFDFEGSQIESIERFFRGFGGRPVPYPQVERRSRRMNALLTAREMTHHPRREIREDR